MNIPASHLAIAVQDATVWIRVTGRANVTVSVEFKKVLQEVSQKGYQQFVLDLTECPIMDSTFLGILAGFTLKLVQAPAGTSSVSLTLLNATPRICELLDNMGIAHLFKQAVGKTFPKDFAETAATPQNPAETARTSLEAHQTLMALDPRNVPKFKDVAQFLAEDLKKLEAKSS